MDLESPGDGGLDGGESRGGRLRAGLGLVGVLVGLVAVLWLMGLGGDGSGSTDAGGEPEGADSELEELEGTDNPPLEVPTTSSPLLETGVADAAREGSKEPFSPLRGRLVYLSGSEVAVVDLAAGAVTLVPIKASGSVIALADHQLLTDRNRTVALSLEDDPPVALLVASSAHLVPSATPLVDYWVITRPDGPGGAVRLTAWQDYGVMSSGLEAPAGSELIVGGEAGLLVAPPVGGTFRPTINGFEIESRHRLLAVGDGLRVEQRCDERLSCTVAAVDRAEGRVNDLPEDFVAELADISVSPDGRWLLNDTSPAWLLDLRTGRLLLLEVGGFGQARWSDDSESVAWLTSDRTPTLVVAQTQPADDQPGWLVVELAGLGADPSPRSTFLLDATLGPN